MGRTSIPCSDETRDKLKEAKEQSELDWDAFLLSLVDEYDTPGISYDDVKNACSAAIRDELPVNELEGY